MMLRRKKLKGLRTRLTQIFGAGEKQIEIGSIKVQNDGLTLHVQHLIFQKQLDKYRRETNRYNVSVDDYMEHTFQPKIGAVFDAIWDHFKLEEAGAKKKDCTVSYQLELDEMNDQA